jgi:type IV secretory pathway protease TraF
MPERDKRSRGYTPKYIKATKRISAAIGNWLKDAVYRMVVVFGKAETSFLSKVSNGAAPFNSA